MSAPEMVCLWAFLLIFSTVVAPPVPPRCLVTLNSYVGDRKTACGDGELKMLSELTSSASDPNYSNVELFEAENAADLIAIRALGIFEYQKHNLANVLLCPKHLSELGSNWKRYETQTTHTKCRLHLEGYQSEHLPGGAAAVRGVTKAESLKVWYHNHTIVSPGTGICRLHRSFIANLPPSYGEPPPVPTPTNTPTVAPEIIHGQRHHHHQPPQHCTPDQELTWKKGLPRKRACSTGSSYALSEPSPDTPATSSTKANCDQVKVGIKTIAKAIGVPEANIKFKGDEAFENLAPSTKRRKVDVASHITDAVISAFAPDAPNQMKEMMFQKEKGDAWTIHHSEKFLGMVEQMVDEYMRADTRRSRRELLALMAPWFERSELQKFIPGLTRYAYKEARRYAKMSKEGLIERSTTQRHLQRYDPKAVIEFLEFITSPEISSELPFGQATARLSTGVKQEIPNLLRTSVNTRIIRQYLMYMKNRGFTQEQLMSNTTMLRILHACKATTRKSMKGIDYLTFEGTEGIWNLLELTKSLKEMNGDAEWATGLSRTLKETKQFFKSDYRAMIQERSEIADYSTWFALSDPIDESFKAMEDGDGHQIHRRCSQCIALMDAFASIEEQINSVNWPTTKDKAIAESTLEQSRDGILNWQKHIIRTIHQDKAREEIIRDLDENSVHVLMDWAMKFLPESGEEPSSRWYGKKGISWHITVALAKKDGRYYQRTYVHVFDHVKQDAEATIAILTDTLKRIKAELPAITSAYARSDNAVCYHGATILTAVPKISDASGIEIKRWDFSETQSGKGPADRAANVIKRHVKLFVAEGNDATTAGEFVTAASSHGGVRSATFIHAKVNVPQGAGRKPSIPGISKYNNYQYSGQEMRVWRAYKIGVGKVVAYTPLAVMPELIWPPAMQMTAGESHASLAAPGEPWHPLKEDRIPGSPPEPATVSRNFSPDDQDNDEEEIDVSQSQTSSNDDPRHLEGRNRQLLWQCDEPGCVKVYQSYFNYFKHVTVGKHLFRAERMSSRDFFILNYVEVAQRNELFRRATGTIAALQNQQTEEAAEDLLYPLPMGFGLKERKEVKKFTPLQKQFLIEKFDEGITNAMKYDSRDVAKMMKNDVRFPSKDDWLTAAQIQSYWSRLALNRERTVAEGNVPILDGDTDPAADDFIGDDHTREAMFEETINEVIQANRVELFDSGVSDSDFERLVDERISTRTRSRAQAGSSRP